MSLESAPLVIAPQPELEISKIALTFPNPDLGYNVNDLDIDDVEEFLERVEARKSECQPCGGTPPSPFYGRTTPMMFGEDYTTFQPPFQQYAGGTDSYGCAQIQNDQNAYTPLPLLDGDVFPLQNPCDDRASVNPAEVGVVVPDFSLLNNSPSPAPSSYSGSAVGDDTIIPDSAPQKTVLVKSELRDKINKRRRESGKEDIVVEWKKPKEETELTERDKERLRRRRESNRRAAQKSRVKKRSQNENLMKDMDDIKSENEKLKDEVDLLREELRSLTSSVCEHIRTCPNPGSLSSSLNPKR